MGGIKWYLRVFDSICLLTNISQEIPTKLLSEYMSTQDQKLMIPLITRNEFIYKTLNPDASDNPYDSVVRYSSSLGPIVSYSSSLGPELPVASRPCLPENLCCSLCKELCMRAIRVHCCNSQVLTQA